MSEIPIEGKVVGQIGEATYYEFSVEDEDLLANMSCAEITGYSIGPVSVDEGSDWDTPVKVAPVSYAGARAVYVGGRGHGKAQAQRQMKVQAELYLRQPLADWAEHALAIDLTPWQRSFVNGLLGSWQETPREELRRRLNNWLRGTYPGEPINWKGLS
jgi:hypothetical protein